jgi:hypothetical protein
MNTKSVLSNKQNQLSLQLPVSGWNEKNTEGWWSRKAPTVNYKTTRSHIQYDHKSWEHSGLVSEYQHSACIFIQSACVFSRCFCSRVLYKTTVVGRKNETGKFSVHVSLFAWRESKQVPPKYSCLFLYIWNNVWRGWLRHWCSSRKVAGSIPDGSLAFDSASNTNEYQRYLLGLKAAGA